MIKLPIVFLTVALFLFSGCKTVNNISTQEPATSQIAFPGAEGFGKYTTGGRGGEVRIVTTLNDAGPGSLRQALKGTNPKIVVFAVAGIIHLQSKLNIPANTTIAGQTAPGDGICIADHPVALNGDNIIVRYLRIRMGDRYQNKGKVHGGGADDVLSGTRHNKIIIDHCSLSWSTDELLSVYAGDSTTLQWNIMSEPLNYSYHFETGDTDFERHGYGGIWGGRHTSGHHNLFAHCASRTPRFDGIRNAPSEFVDFRNNVIYNWVGNNTYAGEGGNYNVVNNYYKYGPSTKQNAKFTIVNPFRKLPEIAYGKFYVNGNYVDGSVEGTKNNWLAVEMDKGTEADAAKAKKDNAFDAEHINTQTAIAAYELVLEKAGASHKRDTLDERIVKNVRNRTGTLIDVQGGYPHGTPYAQTVNAWPALRAAEPLIDTDKDGMPDEWEKKNKLNHTAASDAKEYTLNKFYTNIEVYINELIKL